MSRVLYSFSLSCAVDGRYAGLPWRWSRCRRSASHDEEGTTWGAARVLDVLEFLGRRTSPAPASIIAVVMPHPPLEHLRPAQPAQGPALRHVPRRRARLVARLGGVRAQRRRAALRPRPGGAARVRHLFARPHRPADRHRRRHVARRRHPHPAVPRRERPAARRSRRHLLAGPGAREPGLARGLGRPAAHRRPGAPRAAPRRDQRDGQPHRARRRPRHLRRPGRELLRPATQRLGRSPRAAGGHGHRRRVRATAPRRTSPRTRSRPG